MTRHAIFFLVFCETVFAAWKLTPVISAGVDYPVFVTAAPRDPQRLYIVEQSGRILVWRRGTVERAAFLDIRERVRSGGEMGLLSVAFHPDFGKSGSAHTDRFFVNYTSLKPSLSTVVEEFRVGETKGRELLRIPQPFPNHNGGQIAFGPDGYLYIGMGDGGAAGDPGNRAQNTSELLGKMLRIDVDSGKPYGIPKDNPFADAKKGKPEIFAWGLRNPWRFSFDRKTGRLFAADVGQYEWEEVDIVGRGKNYGWRVVEGTHCYEPAKNCVSKGMEPPIHEYPRSEGQSITGGYVYRGKKNKALEGAYVFADYVSGKIWALREKGSTWKRELLIESRFPISSFGEDSDGELLVVVHRNASLPTLFRIENS
ncbi:MAG: PQQ-dependent sugar dehydrogenase [Bdellovibrionales bacterium]|nr:PQQ-dependent sugar dehydrogenase [Bdellovibrionales bacterium]